VGEGVAVCVAVCCSVLQCATHIVVELMVGECVVVCCSVLQCVLQCVAVCWSVTHTHCR